MSDLHRLMAKAEKDSALSEKFSTLTPEELLRWAESNGYSLTLDEAKDLNANFQELSDEDLEKVAGGWTGPGGP